MKNIIILLMLFVSSTAFGRTLNMQRILSSQSMGASFQSSEVDVSNYDLVSLQAVWTGGGAPAGTFTLQVSNDDISPTNWSTYPGSSVAIAADGDLVYNVADNGFKWIRLAYVRTGGTGTLNSILVTKLDGGR